MRVPTVHRPIARRLLLPLLVGFLVAVVMLTLTLGLSSTKSVDAADDIGQLMTIDATLDDGATVEDIGFGTTQLQRDGADDVTVGITGSSQGPGSSSADVTGDDGTIAGIDAAAVDETFDGGVTSEFAPAIGNNVMIFVNGADIDITGQEGTIGQDAAQRSSGQGTLTTLIIAALAVSALLAVGIHLLRMQLRTASSDYGGMRTTYRVSTPTGDGRHSVRAGIFSTLSSLRRLPPTLFLSTSTIGTPTQPRGQPPDAMDITTTVDVTGATDLQASDRQTQHRSAGDT